jgi:hypothetical protein
MIDPKSLPDHDHTFFKNFPQRRYCLRMLHGDEQEALRVPIRSLVTLKDGKPFLWLAVAVHWDGNRYTRVLVNMPLSVRLTGATEEQARAVFEAAMGLAPTVETIQ